MQHSFFVLLIAFGILPSFRYLINVYKTGVPPNLKELCKVMTNYLYIGRYKFKRA